MTPEQARARGDRFRLWYGQDGLGDALKAIRAVYIERIAALDPADKEFAEKARVLGVAAKVVDQVDAAIMAVVGDGKVARAEIARVAQIEAIPARKRRFL